MKIVSYKNVLGLFTFLFVLGVVIMAAANFMRHMAVQGTVITVGFVVLALAVVIYMAFWRCPACRELLQRQTTVPVSCKSCGHRLTNDKGGSQQ